MKVILIEASNLYNYPDLFIQTLKEIGWEAVHFKMGSDLPEEILKEFKLFVEYEKPHVAFLGMKFNPDIMSGGDFASILRYQRVPFVAFSEIPIYNKELRNMGAFTSIIKEPFLFSQNKNDFFNRLKEIEEWIRTQPV